MTRRTAVLVSIAIALMVVACGGGNGGDGEAPAIEGAVREFLGALEGRDPERMAGRVSAKCEGAEEQFASVFDTWDTLGIGDLAFDVAEIDVMNLQEGSAEAALTFSATGEGKPVQTDFQRVVLEGGEWKFENCFFLVDFLLDFSSTLAPDEREESPPSSSVPVGVPGLEEGVTDVAVGDSHTCALMTSGEVKCWGRDDAGQLGDGEITQQQPFGSPEPRDVVELGGDVISIVAGRFHTCALTKEGVVKCWGGNWSGQLGDGTDVGPSPVPVEVLGLDGAALAISSGSDHVCALITGGRVRCWGDRGSGQLGAQSTELCNLGYTQCSTTPLEVEGLTGGVSAISAGGTHTCAVITDGAVMCWGGNFFGQLGAESTEDCGLSCSSTPLEVEGLTGGVSAISAGGPHTCAVITDGAVMCWGDNSNGQLGDRTTTQRRIPVSVCSGFACEGSLLGVVALAAGSGHTCALTSVGGVTCWGSNSAGQLGADSSEGCGRCNFAVDVVGLESGVTKVVTGAGNTCAILTSRELKCWGDNSDGKLGVAPAD